MKKLNAILTGLIAGLVLGILSCNDPLQIGTELVDDNDVDFFTTDTFQVNGLTTQLDSIVAYNITSMVQSRLRLGNIIDPIFGGYKSNIVSQILPTSSSRPIYTVIDSVVLALEVDTASLYGMDNPVFDIMVKKLKDPLNPLQAYYADQTFDTDGIIGMASGVVQPAEDSMEIVRITSFNFKDTLNVPSHLRITLDKSLGQQILDIDSTDYTRIDSFTNAFPGLFVEVTNNSNGLIPLNLSGSESRLIVYYDSRSGFLEFGYSLGSVVFGTAEHDYSTGLIDGHVDNSTLSKDKLFTQGGAGPSISVSFPSIENLGSAIINEAILEFTVLTLSGDDMDLYPLPGRIYTFHKPDSIYTPTNDVLDAFQFADIELFGGSPIEVSNGGNIQYTYKLNVSEHLQKIVNGEALNEIVIQLASKATAPNRVVFAGQNDPNNPIKLKLTYTKI